MSSGYVALLGALLLHLSLGNFSTSGNLMPYLASYMRTNVDPTIGHAEIQWIAAASQVAYGFFSILGGKMEYAIGTRLCCMVGSLILSFNILVSYSAVQTSLPMLVVTYGFFLGFGTTLIYSVPIYAAMQWFPTKPGLVCGVVMAVYYIGYMSSMFIQTQYLNPDNSNSNLEGYFDDPQLMKRVPSLFLWMAGAGAVLQFFGVLCISRPTADESLCCVTCHSECSDASVRDVEAPNSSTCECPVLTPSQLIRHPDFRIIWLTYLLNCVVGVSIITTFKSFGETFIYDDTFLTYVGCSGAAMNAFGSIFWGYIMDKTSYKTCMIAITTILTVFVGTLPVVPYIGKWAFVSWGLALYFTISGNYSVMPAVLSKRFGSTHAPSNIGVLFTSQGVAALWVAVGIQVFLEKIDYSGCYASEAVFTAIALFLTTRLPDWKQPQ